VIPPPPETPGTLTWLGHSTVLIELDGVRLLTDPLLRGRVAHLRRTAPLGAPPADVDAVLVSHGHHDHLDPASLARLGRDQRIVVPRAAGGPLRRRGFRAVEQVRAGEEIRIGPVVVRATVADHAGLRFGALAPPWRRAEDDPALGFVIAGRRVVYFAGDTDLFPGMADLAPDLDVALLPVWGWGSGVGAGHLDPPRAAHALRLLRPRVAVPIHWGTLGPLWRRAASGPDAEPALAFQRHARDLAPSVEVRVLPPGGTTAF
jgi:L-ascorbate metabolism protein UlaG (beta-lactamase superfamily)